MKNIIVGVAVALSFLTACGKDDASTATAAAAVNAVTSVSSTITKGPSDPDGVASVDCPSGTGISGGGCDCTGATGVIFGAVPVGNSYLCGCSSGAVVPSVVCGSTTMSAVTDAAITDGTEDLVRMEQAFRSKRAALTSE